MKRIAILFLICCLAACSPMSLKSEKKPPLIYRLATPEGGCPGSKTIGALLDVLSPEMPAGFDTDQIAVYLSGGRRLDYAAGARWPDNLDDVLQTFVISVLNQDCSGLIAQTPRFNTPGAYRLVVKIRDFEPVYMGAAQNETPELRVAAAFTLVSLPDGTVMSDFTLAKKSRSRVNSLTAITAGLEGLLRDMVGEARGRLVSTVSDTKKEL